MANAKIALVTVLELLSAALIAALAVLALAWAVPSAPSESAAAQQGRECAAAGPAVVCDRGAAAPTAPRNWLQNDWMRENRVR